MRFFGIGLAVLVAWGGLTFLTSRGLTNKQSYNPKQEFNKLVAELSAAHDARLDRRSQNHQSQLADAEAVAVIEGRDARVAIMRDMDALAEENLNTPAGADLAIDTFLWSWNLDVDLERLVKRFARIVNHFPNHPDLVDPVGSVPQAFDKSGSPSEWVSLLQKLTATTRDKDLRIGALYVMGQVQMESGSTAAAKQTFERILTAYADSEYVPRVKGLIYEIEKLQPGMPAPAFTTKSLDGESITLDSLRGKVVLLNFWATWCPSCVAEIPHLREAYASLRGDGREFEILNVSLDSNDSNLPAFVRRLEMPGIQTWEWVDDSNPVGKLFNVFSLPSWFLIDDTGVIRARNPFGEKLESSVTEISR